MSMKVLVLNAGSSSQKSCLYDLADDLPNSPPSPLWQAQIDWSGSKTLEITVHQITQTIPLESTSRADAIAKMISSLVKGKTKVLDKLTEIDSVGHRVVHGGTAYSEATLITEEVKAEIERLSVLAPSHHPAHLEGMAVLDKVLPHIPQIAVFDTAFHSHMPRKAAVYPIPYHWYEQGIRRYGFHGISHQYCAQTAADLLDRPLASLKLITCHLGNGCSLAAIKAGISVNTTMGFTPLEGLMMGERSGSIDPAIVIHLMREHHLSVDEVDAILNKNAGLKGVSGLSSDFRHLQEAIQQGNQRAALAVDLFMHRLKSEICALLADLEGLDALVFTAGIGENVAMVREEVCEGLKFLGIQLDLAKNVLNPVNENVALPDSAIQVWVIHTEENWAIARCCWQYLHSDYLNESL